MYRKVLKSKIHRIKVKNTNLNYEGSIEIDRDILKQADILPYEVVQVINLNTGARFETYTIKGEKGACSLQGGAARLGEIGDELLVFSYELMDAESVERHTPKIVYP